MTTLSEIELPRVLDRIHLHRHLAYLLNFNTIPWQNCASSQVALNILVAFVYKWSKLQYAFPYPRVCSTKTIRVSLRNEGAGPTNRWETVVERVREYRARVVEEGGRNC